MWRDEATLGTRQGKLGKNGTTRSKSPGNTYFAINEYLKAIRAKRAAGFVEVFVEDDAV